VAGGEENMKHNNHTFGEMMNCPSCRKAYVENLVSVGVDRERQKVRNAVEKLKLEFDETLLTYATVMIKIDEAFAEWLEGLE
jgi:hypothetical protein